MDEMKAFAAMAHNCVFMTADYPELSAPPGKGGCGLLRSALRTDAGNNQFTAYAAGGFNWENRWFGEAMCICLSPWGSGSDF